MDKLTAIRCFAAPGFTPAKRVRIRNDRWYLVRFQNVETNPLADYVGLADGEYVRLLPGIAARQAREARLNHCNAIQEYAGPVFETLTSQYGHEITSRGFFPTEADAQAEVTRQKTAHDKWIADCLKQSEKYLANADKVRRGEYPKSIMSADHYESSARDCVRVATENAETFKSEIRVIR